jgi:hypothetical protein
MNRMLTLWSCAGVLQVLVLLLPRPTLAAPVTPCVAVERGTNQAGTYIEAQLACFPTASPIVTFEQKRQLAITAARRPWTPDEALDTDSVCISALDATDRTLLSRPAVERELRLATRARGNEACRQPEGPFNASRALGCLRCVATTKALPGWPGMSERLGLIITTAARGSDGRSATIRVHLVAPECRRDADCAAGQRCFEHACAPRGLVSIRRDVNPMSYGVTRTVGGRPHATPPLAARQLDPPWLTTVGPAPAEPRAVLRRSSPAR